MTTQKRLYSLYKNPKYGLVNKQSFIENLQRDNIKYSEKLIDLMRNMLTPNPLYRPNVYDLIKVLE